MTLTNGAASVTVTARGITGGNDRNGYMIFVSFNQEPGEAPATGCAVRANSAGAGEGDPFPTPYTSISVPILDVSYNSCREFIDTGYSSPMSNFLQETVQLSLRK
jgi:hypothetical protein